MLSETIVPIMFACSLVSVFEIGKMASQSTQDVEYPRIESADIPLYPPNARLGIQGVVKILVVTDGKRVISADIESGHPMLAQASVKCVKSWRFEKHDPMRFTTTFKYIISKELYKYSKPDEVFLRLPMEVSVKSMRIVIWDPAKEKK